jgi:hypothetical protein
LALFALAVVQVIVNLADIARRMIHHRVTILLGDAELRHPRRHGASQIVRRRPVDLPGPAGLCIKARNEPRHCNSERVRSNRPLLCRRLRSASSPFCDRRWKWIVIAFVELIEQFRNGLLFG